MTVSLTPPLNPTPDWAAAQTAFDAFLSRLDRAERLVGLYDSDADGVTAGVLWERTFTRLGFASVQYVIPDRERNAWTEPTRARLMNARPNALYVMDLGSQPHPVLRGIPTCFLDHHRPEGIPLGDTLICAYAWKPTPNTSWLLWELCQPYADLTDSDWIAAIGTLSDLGENAGFSLLASVKKRYTAKYLKEATTLINAGRRASDYIPETAAQALRKHDSPRALVESASPEVAALRDARDEVKAALNEAKKASPVFAGRVALIRLHSACQIHPLIAQIWRSRLPKYIVIAANDGYMPGRVNFSGRSTEGQSVLEYLRGLDIGEGEGNFGLGHDQASGGSLPVERWNRLLVKMGFASPLPPRKP